MGVAMVSFCDIPFSLAANHIKSYGKYAIGLSKDWANRKGLNPVLYIGKNTPIIGALDLAFNGLRDMLEIARVQNTGELDYGKIVGPFSQISESSKLFLCFIKHYKDDLYRHQMVKKDYVFYDEREWRYIPSYFEKYFHEIESDWSDEEIKKKKQEWKKELDENEIKLPFEITDVTYIILNKNSEIPKFISFIEDILPRNDMRYLISRITTVENIKNDF